MKSIQWFGVALVLVALPVLGGSVSKMFLDPVIVQEISSVSNLVRTGNGTVITDNSASFEKKLELIRSAQERLDLAYYIISDDESSSVLLNELLLAAKRGVKVRVLADYAVSYSNLDLFLALEGVSKGNIEFRFFNRPTPNIIKDAIYMSSSCSEEKKVSGREAECNLEKAEQASVIKGLTYEEALNYNTGFSGVFLSSVYSQSALGAKYVLSQGAKLDLNSGGSDLSEDDKKGLLTLAKLYKRMKTGSVMAGVKLKFAALSHGDAVTGVINMIENALPSGTDGYDDNRGEDWNHFSDFLHHKLLIKDNSDIILGGRNIENSYHMEANPSGKYTFMDTDVHFPVSDTSGEAVRKTFDSLWNFSRMVATTSDIMKHAPNDVVKALDKCAIESRGIEEKIWPCFGQIVSSAQAVGEARVERQLEALEKIKTQIEKYNQIPPARSNSPAFDISQSAQVSYLENLPFKKENGKLVRVYGAGVRDSVENEKNIHEAWVRGMISQCYTDEPRMIYMHQAYFLLPSNLLQAMAVMTKTIKETHLIREYNKVDCSNVQIKIVTNSIPTTDLSVINVIARHQVHELFKAIETMPKKNRKKAASVEYYEYVRLEEDVNRSLHTKVTVMGTDVIIGSANADFRSLMMDTNNAVLVRGDVNLANQYSAYMESLISTGRVIRMDQTWRDYKAAERRVGTVVMDGKQYPKLAIDVETEMLVDAMADAALASGKTWPKPERIASMKELLFSMGRDVRMTSAKVMDKFLLNQEDSLRAMERSSNQRTQMEFSNHTLLLRTLYDYDKLYMPL